MTEGSRQSDSLTGDRMSPAQGVWPLVPFERFLLRSDSPRTPIVFRVLMRFEGPFQRDLLTEAFRIAIARQPLLTSRIVTANGQLAWHPDPDFPELQWQPDGASQAEIEKTPIDWLDLSRRPGMHARIWPVDDGLTILLDVHHACCDGQGARQFLGEWWGLYHQLLEGKTLELARLEPEQLAHRGVYRTPQPPVGFREGLRNLYVTIRGKTIHVPRRSGTETLDGRSDHLCEQALSVEETGRLRDRVKQAGYTVNDVAVTASFLAFAKCYPELIRSRRYITLLHPVDLRWPSDLKTPACNRVGVGFLRCPGRDLKDPRKVLGWVRSEMQYIKRRYIGAEFLRGLSLTEKKTGITDALQNWGYFVPTLQFTGLGDTTRAMQYQFPVVDGTINFHGLKLNRISGTMQLGPFMPISLTSCETNQRMTLTLRGSAGALTMDQAEQFLSTYVEQLLSVVPEPGK